MRIARNPSAIFDMCPSKRPIAIEELSWNKWFVHGNGYGLKGNVEPHTELHPVLFTIPIFDRPRPVIPWVYCHRRFFSFASSCVTRRSQSLSSGVLTFMWSSAPVRFDKVRSLSFSVSIAARVSYHTPTGGCGLKFVYRDGDGSRRLRVLVRRLIAS